MRGQGFDAPVWFCCGLLLLGAAGAPAERRARAPIEGLVPAPRPARMDPDALTTRELRALPGIGPARALAVVRARWDGLRGGPAAWLALPGIGEATVGAASGYLFRAAMEPPSERAYTRRDPP